MHVLIDADTIEVFVIAEIEYLNTITVSSNQLFGVCHSLIYETRMMAIEHHILSPNYTFPNREPSELRIGVSRGEL